LASFLLANEFKHTYFGGILMELIFYRIVNDYYIKLHTTDNKELVKIDCASSIDAYNKKIVPWVSVMNFLPVSETEKKSIKTKNCILLINGKLISVLSVPRIYIFNEYINTFEYKSKYLAESFRRGTRQTLLDYLQNEDEQSIDKTLSALMAYTFTDSYSFWLYNPYAKKFHLFGASFNSDIECVSEDNDKHSLKNFMDEIGDSNYISRSIMKGVVNCTPLSDMKFINRIKICSKNNTDFKIEGILTFYSRYENFSFNKEMVEIIKNAVELKLAAYMSCYLTDYSSSLSRLTEVYNLGNLNDSLQKFTDYLAKELHYEAVSIWFAADSSRKLQLGALTEEPGRNLTTDPVVDYDISKQSLTVTAYRENRVICSYDISRETNNSNLFNERTRSPPKNWIAIPISKNYGVKKQALGVLRVKNKYKIINGNNTSATIDKIDIDMLKNITADIAYLKQIENNYIEQRNEANSKLLSTIKESEKANDFIKTFRHELKSPLTTLTLASEDIKDTLAELKLITDPNNLPKKLRDTLNDLSAVGSRLAFVTNYLTFDAQGLIKDIGETFLFKDIIAPVLQFAEPYAKKRQKKIFLNKDSIIRLPKVICDSNAAAIVFNILIDNAIKYARPGSEICIYSKLTKSGQPCIVIENEGIGICDEERDEIFKKYIRGEMAVKQKTEGSGIGLYLAREIMNLNNGEIRLTNTNNPVRFELQINKEAKK
jgi:signal transduction histidine kinase